MSKPSITRDALAEAVEASRKMVVPRIEDLRPRYFTRSEYERKMGITRYEAARVLSGSTFECIGCTSQGRKAWAYRLRK